MTNTLGASLVAQRVKNLPAMQETWVGSPGREDPLEDPWVGKIPWRKEQLRTPVFLHGEFPANLETYKNHLKIAWTKLVTKAATNSQYLFLQKRMETSGFFEGCKKGCPTCITTTS